jgi:predicted esterase
MKHYIISGILLILSFRAVSQVFQPYENQVLYSWAFPYESYQFGGMQFRLKTPNNFDSLGVEKYPLILFLHGAGEGGDSNEKQLIHGGRNTLDAITSGEFPGLALYPQATGSKWLAIQINQAKAIVDQLILNYNVDPNRIYVHGLSGGADGTWRFAYAYPELVAAIHPMSGVPGFGEAVGVTRFIPTWLAQGGKDGNPSPFDGNSRVEKMRTDGANIRYSYQPNTGHGTWNTQYNKPDFFTWFLDKSKTDITVEYGQSSFCEGETININLGITAGFNNYEWAKNNTTNIISSGAGVNRINVTVPGLYYVRFRRGTEWTEWSDPVDVNFNLAAAAVVSTETGNQSLNLPALSGQQSVEISGPQDIAFYQWINNAFPINGATGASYIVNEAGSYSLSVRPEQETGYDPDGMTPSEFRAAPQPCFSDPSDPVIITTENDLNVPAKPTNFAANVLNDNSVTINWDDIANNELAFELYRSTQSGSQYNLVKRILSNTSPNPQLYIDQPVEANTTYYYRMRAVNNSGGSVYTEEVSTTTALDVEPPTAPLLSLAGTSSNSISLSWTTSSDNVGVVNYEVYRDNNLIATVTGTSYVNVSLPSNQIYSYTVRANDLSGNISVPSNQITARTINSGLTYSYYHHNNLSVVSQIETNGTLIRTGNINNFDITIRDQNERFAFVFEGFIFIPEAGTYTFYTSSDDGSRLFINGNSVVNNDGPHGCNERNGQVTLAAGFAQIRVPFFENGGGECLQVRWQGPGIAKQLIPDEVLFEDEFVPANAPLAPTTLSVIGSSNDQIDLNWQDNSNDENSFEIYRSLALNSGYEVVQVVDANVTEWSDTGLSGSTTYYYKLKAINFNGSSEFVGPASTATLVNPPTPAAPTDLLLSVVNVKDVELSWTDNANNELGFEIYRSTANIASTFTLIHTTNENITNYVDTQTSGNSQYFYRVRAKGVESFSAYSAILNINTPNTAPAIEPIINRSVKFGTTLNLHVAVDDADGDPLTFTFDPVLPPFISFADNGYGQGEFTISPVLANEGVYTIDFSVTDGSGGTDSESFVITVSDNDNPTISSIANLEMNEGFTEYIYVSVTDETLPTVTLQASNLPAFITFTDDGSGNGTFEIAPQIGDAGNYNNIKVIASDGEGGFSESTFNVTVNAVKRNYSVQVNFGPTAAPAPWNNIAGKGNSFFSLISNDGISQDINFDIFNQFYTEGHTTTLTSDDYPNEVTQSFLWKNSGDAIFTLENLNPGLSYDITFLVAVGSEFTTKTIGSNTRFTINNVLKTASPNNGLVNTVKFVELRPDAFGQIRITPNGNQYILNAMVVDVYYDDGLVPIAPSNLSLTATSSSEVEVSWQDNSNNEQRFEVYRSNVSETGPFQLVQSTLLNENTYTDINLESSTLYYYKVRSVNANGVGETAVELVTTLNSAPTITPIADVIMKTGESLSIPLNALDNEGDPITLSGANLPAFAQLIDNGDGTGQVSITTGNDDIGFYEGIVITAEDNFGNNSSISFLISVTDASFDNAVYINFGSGSDAVTPWNNINTLPNLGGVVNGFSNSNGDPSVFGIRVGSNWTSVDNTGLPVSYSSSFPYDQQVLEGAWKSDSVEWNEGTQNPSLEIIGLDENAIYNIALIVATNRWKKSLADYNFQGTSKRINPLSNEENTYYFNSISPNALGNIFTLML